MGEQLIFLFLGFQTYYMSSMFGSCMLMQPFGSKILILQSNSARPFYVRIEFWRRWVMGVNFWPIFFADSFYLMSKLNF